MTMKWNAARPQTNHIRYLIEGLSLIIGRTSSIDSRAETCYQGRLSALVSHTLVSIVMCIYHIRIQYNQWHHNWGMI